MKVLSYIGTTVLGLMFLISAFAKAWDAEVFADMLLLYGQPWFSIGAPLVIGIEAVLGTMLLLRVSPRRNALAADIFLVSVSVIFAYGVLAKGIQDCGCFGALSKYYTSKPWMTFARNAVFILLSIPALLEKPKEERYLWPKATIGLGIAAVACFICGLAMRDSFELPKYSIKEIENSRAQAMEKLQAIYPFDADSSYVVFLFSFSCAHCQNSFANVQQFQQFHTVDKVLGIAVENEEAQARFYRIYQPEIEIRTIPENEMTEITNSLPIGLVIKNNVIQKAESGFITSPGIFIK